MINPKVYLVHAMSVSVAPSGSSFARLWPLARATHLLDESLASDLMTLGGSSAMMADRFRALGRYCEAAGAHAILFTCSAFGAAINAVKHQQSFPVLHPYEGLFEDLVERGGRVALLTTFPPSGLAMAAELQDLARRRGVPLDVEPQLVAGALDALLAGDHAGHDRLIAEHAASLRGFDSIALGQFSMASAFDVAQSGASAPVLTTPDSAVRRLQRLLAQASDPSPAPSQSPA